MSLPRYPEYKDSRVEWLGDVPAHWSISKLRHVVGRIESGVSVNSVDEPVEGDAVGVLKTSCVYSGDFDARQNKAVVQEEIERVACSVLAGTLIVSRMNTPALVGAAGLASESLFNIYLPDRLWQVHLRDVYPKYLHYWTRSKHYRAQVEMVCAGTSSSMQNLSQPDFLGFYIALPEVAEQIVITSFLDRETAGIDALIAEQQMLLVLLAEKRQATISRAVTRGLDPNVSMKNSGIPWLGDVPGHWTQTTLGRASSERCDGPFGSAIKSDHYKEAGALVVRLQNISAVKFNLGKPVFLNLKYFEESLKGHEVRAGDLLVAGLGDENNLLGRACVAPEGLGPALVKADCFRFRLHPEKALSAFVAMQLSAGAAFDAGQMATGTTRARMPLGVMASRKLVLPPVHEQAHIVAFANEAAHELDALSAEARRGVEILRERRQSLIAAAVTGEIDVRGLVDREAA